MKWWPRNADLGYPKPILQCGKRSLYSNRTKTYFKAPSDYTGGIIRRVIATWVILRYGSQMLSADTLRLLAG